MIAETFFVSDEHCLSPLLRKFQKRFRWRNFAINKLSDTFVYILDRDKFRADSNTVPPSPTTYSTRIKKITN